jgi:HNH endonuclease
MPKAQPISARLEKYIYTEPNTGCWLWGGHLDIGGYGKIVMITKDYPRGKPVMAHRVCYELHRGPIPDGLYLDHLCRVRCCVNPWHLEPVTMQENILRGMGSAGVYARRTHCNHGHPFDLDNTTLVNLDKNPRPYRRCKECSRTSALAYYYKNRKQINLKRTRINIGE